MEKNQNSDLFSITSLGTIHEYRYIKKVETASFYFVYYCCCYNLKDQALKYECIELLFQQGITYK